MELRMILYGYKKEMFSYYIEENEAKTVREVFSRYISGETLLQIANSLTDRQIIYYKDKYNWSKQAVRRILENNHYCGDMEYPAIITKNVFENANSKRLSKGGTREKDSDEISWLKEHSFCEQCGDNFRRRSHWSRSREKWGYGCGCNFDVYIDDNHYFSKIISVLNKVIGNSSVLQVEMPENKYEPTLEILKEEKEINRMYEQSNPQFKTIKSAIFHSVSNKYREITYDTSAEYTELLMNFFDELSNIESIDLALMRKAIKKIMVKKNGEIKVQFINDAIVESEEINDGTSAKSTVTKDSNEN